MLFNGPPLSRHSRHEIIHGSNLRDIVETFELVKLRNELSQILLEYLNENWKGDCKMIPLMTNKRSVLGFKLQLVNALQILFFNGR